jgi:hypothetical protein
LAELDLSAPGLTDLSVDGQPAEGSVVYVEPGHHFVYAKKDDRVARSDVDVVAGSVTQVSLTPPPDLPAPANAAAPPAPLVAPAPEVPHAPAETAAPETPAAKTRGTHVLPPWAVIAGAAVTAVGIAGTIWSGVETAEFKSDVYDASPTSTNLDAGLERQRRTNIFLCATLGVAAVTGVLAIWFVDFRGSSPAKVGLSVDPTSALLRAQF